MMMMMRDKRARGLRGGKLEGVSLGRTKAKPVMEDMLRKGIGRSSKSGEKHGEKKRRDKELTDSTVNLTPETHRRSFGENPDSSVKYRTIQLVSSIRTLMRSKGYIPFHT